MNEYKDKITSIEERMQNNSAEIAKIDYNTSRMNINLEEQLRKINRLNSDFFNLYNKVRILSIFSIISSVLLLIFMIVMWIVK